MTRIPLIALAFVACKKDAPKPAQPEHVAEEEEPAGGAELTCEDVAKNPVIANEPGLAQKFLDYCAEHPGEIPQSLLRCAMDAKSLDALESCEDGEPREEPAKRNEAEVNLEAIKKGAKAYYAEHAAYPAGSVPLTPVDVCCDSGMAERTCPVDAAQWTHEVWDALGFSIDDPHYYRYAYERTDTGFVASAVGDLDCDDAFATYTLEATSGDSGPIYTLTKPARAD